MTDKFMWSPNLITFLISLYRSHKCLYDTTHPDYVHRAKREKSMVVILKELQRINPNLQMHYVRTKLHNLRTQYMREHRKVVNSIRIEGNSNKATYKPTLWCYEKLRFLRKHRKKKDLIASIEKDDVVCSPDEDDQEYDAMVSLTYEDDHLASKSPIPTASTTEQSANLRIIPCTSCNNKVGQLLHKDSKIPSINSCTTVPPANLRNDVVASTDRDNYATPKTLNSNASKFTSVPPASLCVVRCNTTSEANDVVASSDKSNYPTSNRRNTNVEKLEHEMMQQLGHIKGVLTNRVKNKSKSNKYDWLGKQVVFEINKINNEVLQEETAWAIQSILRRNVCKDRTWRQQDFYRSQNQNHVSSTPKNVQTIRTVTINPNASLEEDPLAEVMQDIIEEDFS